MAITNRESISKALELLRDGLRPKCEDTWRGFYGSGWLGIVNSRLHIPDRHPTTGDVAFLFKAMKATWNETFGHGFPPAVRSLVFELSDVRNKWAHQHSFTTDDAIRALDSMERVLDAFGNLEHRQEIRRQRRDLIRRMFEAESRYERRRTAARPTEGKPTAGLTPWREIIAPHADVASGRFEQAEFAADLSEVADGSAEEEYQDPRAFFARTFLTGGLRTLLMGAVRRLSGGGGDPVIELQTNFGGGKTHSLIALYHLASGVPAHDLPGISEVLAEEGLSLPPRVARAVIVGQMIKPATPEPVEEGISLHTLWGQLAYQLGGRSGYEMVRTDDEAGTNPGAALKSLFRKFGPAIVLIDEWVAYARQLRDAGVGKRLAGGDFDTQFTFAQALTETAAAADNVVVLVSIPSSDIEVGGERGREALERLKNVVQRKAAQWQPASPDESFEIVRRRLFDPIPDDKARVRDGVIRAFSDMYRKRAAGFRSEVSEADYRRRMELSYPIHPELFDRLFGDWSALDKFQRTRGVLRLMALAVSQLWQRGDRSLLIMPGNLPMDSGALVSELKKYLEEGWDPIIKSDVDGPNALPLIIDREDSRFGQLSAVRRVARTIYMGSAPRPDGSRGVDVKSVVLGCVQPGEPIGRFEDALKRLSGRAAHLYFEDAQYWYSLKPNVTRIANDRAASNFTDADADDLIHRRLVADRRRGAFVGVHVFPGGPGDVPDEDDGVRLVVVDPSRVHYPNDNNSPAIGIAGKILSQRSAGPRFHQNLIVFVAASEPRLKELRDGVRKYLAWKSIDDDDRMELTAAQQKHVIWQLAQREKMVASRIDETFVHILTPFRAPGTNELNWHKTRPTGNGSLPERVTNKLKSEEKLILNYSAVRVRMDLDRFSLWKDRGDVEVGYLWSTYTDYLYMPRLAGFGVLEEAISKSSDSFNWSEETFAYAEAHNGETWVGIKVNQLVKPARSGLLLRPDVVPMPSEGTDGKPSVPKDPLDIREITDGSGSLVESESEPSGPRPGRFYASFDLDPVRGIHQLNKIMSEVTNHLGEGVKLTLEVEAELDKGFDERTRRVVSENASNLGANGAEFE